MRRLLAFMLAFAASSAWAVIPTPTAQWDVNAQGRSGDSCFYEQINGTLETCTGSPAVDTSNSYDGIDFDGTDDYVTVNFAASALTSGDVNSDFTMCARVEVDTPSVNYEWFMGYADSATTAIRIGMSTDENEETAAAFVDGTNSNFSNPSPDAPQDGSENVICYSREDGGDLVVYLNGTEEDSDAGTFATVTADGFEIGAQDTQNTARWFLDGTILWVAVWTSDLTVSEIQELDDSDNPFDTTPTISFDDSTPDLDVNVVITLSQALAGGNPTKLINADTSDEVSCVSATSTTCTLQFDSTELIDTGDLDNTTLGVAYNWKLSDGTNESATTQATINLQQSGSYWAVELTCDEDGTPNDCNDDSLMKGDDWTALGLDTGDEVLLVTTSGVISGLSTDLALSGTPPLTANLYAYTAGEWLAASTLTVNESCERVISSPISSPIMSPVFNSLCVEVP